MFTRPIVTAKPVDALLRERKLAVEQLDLALRNLRPNAMLMPAFAAVICIIFRHWIATSHLVVWFSMVVITGLPLGLISFRFDSAKNAAMAVRTRIRLSTLSYLVFTSAWSLMGVLLW